MIEQILENFKTAYSEQPRVRIITLIMLPVLAILFYLFQGGFPPLSWQLLMQAAPTLPQLWQQNGPMVLFPFTGLVMLALTVVIGWGFLLWLTFWCIQQRWLAYQEQRLFAEELKEAEALVFGDMEEEQQWLAAVPSYEAISWPTQPKNPIPLHQNTAERTNMVSRSTSKPAARIQPAPAPIRPIRQSASLEVVEQPTPPDRDDPFDEIDDWLNSAAPVTTTSKPPQQIAHSGSRYIVGTGLDEGIKRKGKPNEDSLLAIQGTRTYGQQTQAFGLFVIADGMGGHARGAEASQLAVQKMRDTIIPMLTSNVVFDDDNLMELLVEGVQKANLAVYQRNQQTNSFDMMGTTLTAALVVDTTAFVASVGDSRTYRYDSEKGLVSITEDHSVVARLVKEGIIKPEEVYTHPRRNEILRCIGEHPSAQVDSFIVQLEIEDSLLLCSDGLWEMVRPATIEQVLEDSLPDANRASQELVKAALNGGGLDNISVIVMHLYL